MRPIDPRHYYRRYLHPKYWHTWILIGFLRLLSFLPHGVLQGVGRLIGLFSYVTAREHRRIADINIGMCFPELNEQERRKLVRESMVATGKGYVESTKGWWGNMAPYANEMQVHGLEHFEEAKRRGKGILLLGGHFSILDFAGPLAAQIMDFNHMYRPNNNPLFDALIERKRRRFSGRAFTRRQLHDMIEFIKKGNIVWYGCDQDFGRKHCVFAPFFGVPAATLTTPAWVARKTGATVIFISQFREGGKTYSIHFSEIFEGYPSDDEVENATRLNQEIEKMVRQYPEQYLWVHRRFKTRPNGEPSPYPDRDKTLRKRFKKWKKRRQQKKKQ